jgi:hypothetical protein
MENCESKFGKIKSPKKEIVKLGSFCKLLSTNKVKNSKEEFLELDQATQCLLLYYAHRILNSKLNVPDKIYRNAFYLFKLFRGKDMKEIKTYSLYKNQALESLYKKALEWNRENSSSSKSSPSSKRTKKVFTKKFQKYESKKELDPLYIYYTSLYAEKPKSQLAVTWLVDSQSDQWQYWHHHQTTHQGLRHTRLPLWFAPNHFYP